VIVACSALDACTDAPRQATERAAAQAADASTPDAPEPARPPRARVDGRAFPAKVLALTWDDGPDEGTLELARYLRDQHVRATFFVVGAWVDGLSEEPGQGTRVFQTGYDALPVTSQLVELGHRIGNHTRNHVLLAGAAPETVRSQLADNQRGIPPWPGTWLRMFRAPGGAFGDATSAAVDADPSLSTFVGPVHWDIDAKDWEGSLYCRSDRPAIECEPAAPGGASRVKPTVIAARYLATIDAVGRGVVLLHDRVGHVGSDYARRVARALVPELAARGYVFAAPVLAFSPLAPDPGCANHAATSVSREAAAVFADVDPALVQEGDVDGDGHADVCALRGDAVWCALGSRQGRAAPQRWAPAQDFAGARVVRLGDVNGDGRADLCVRTARGLLCALSTGRGFLAASLWLAELGDAGGWAAREVSIRLVDLDGDGRADVCADGEAGPVRALAP
jgi:peptidoglycan/xylan/chitin deacetylase (PgdA/CDA1 family)